MLFFKIYYLIVDVLYIASSSMHSLSRVIAMASRHTKIYVKKLCIDFFFFEFYL